MKIGFNKETITAGMVHESMDRLDSGSYGKCERCRRSISAARLASNPAARLCAECQAQSEITPIIPDRILAHPGR